MEILWIMFMFSIKKVTMTRKNQPSIENDDNDYDFVEQ
jgi:hypothetical protein